MKMGDAFPSRWISQEDLGDEVFRLTIEDVRSESVGQGKSAEDRPILHFREASVGAVKIKPFILSAKINWKVIAKAYGDDSDQWVGKQIDLYVDPNVMYGDEQKGGIRIRIPAGATTTPAPEAKAPLPDILTIEQAVATAVGAGMAEAVFKEKLRPQCEGGYKAARDTIKVRAIISEFQFSQSDTSIPF